MENTRVREWVTLGISKGWTKCRLTLLLGSLGALGSGNGASVCVFNPSPVCVCYIKMRYKSRTHQSKEIIMHSKYFRCLHPNTRTPSALCVISMCIIAFLSVAHANSVRSAGCILHQLLACIMEQFIVFVFIYVPVGLGSTAICVLACLCPRRLKAAAFCKKAQRIWWLMQMMLIVWNTQMKTHDHFYGSLGGVPTPHVPAAVAHKLHKAFSQIGFISTNKLRRKLKPRSRVIFCVIEWICKSLRIIFPTRSALASRRE